MIGKRYVVLDKSFLRSAPKNLLMELSGRYDFLASATLMGECFQTFLPSQERDEETRKFNVGALMKFSDASCSLYSMPSVEYLVGLEVSTRRPCWPIEDYVRAKIQLNPTYFDEQYRMRDQEAPVVEGWSEKVRENVQLSVESYNRGELWPTIEWDEDLKKMAEQNPRPCSELKKLARKLLPSFRRRIVEDENFLRAQYEWMRPFGHPSADKINPKWLLFRTIQVMLLVHLNLLEKNAAHAHGMTDKNTTHEWLDFQYCLLAAQIGALATGEHSQKERFLQLNPQGRVLFYDAQTRSVME